MADCNHCMGVVMKLSTESVRKPVDNRRATDAEPDAAWLDDTTCDSVPPGVLALLVVASFVAGVATGLLLIFSLTAPI